MQLRSLEIHGFKSFADKTQFLFDEGITGVVGPNGCGKSNIVDSIRWVLGEQRTRNLRSEKMENIIFNGTSSRKKANFAQVTLSFENTKNILPTEYSHVSISRKLYRSGDSEYFINGIQCRLKDIQNLFLDTGVGPDSYAIIELKMVDEILNDKEGSRRALFEEAAGISKYKIRKKETLRRLKATQDDLERVQDIVFEIEKQLRSLEYQARKARKYYELKEKYKLLSSQHAFFTIRNLRQRYTTIEKEEQGFGDQLTAIQSAIAKHEARILELKKEQIENERQLAESQRDLNQHNAKIQQIETDKSIRNERLKYLQQREYAIKDQLENEKRQHKTISEELVSLEKVMERVRVEHSEAEKELARRKSELEEARALHEERKLQTEGMIQEHREMEQELARLQKEREIKQIQVQSLSNEMKRNEQDRSTKSEELDAFADKLASLQKEQAALQKEVDALREKKESNDAAREETVQKIDNLKDEVYKKSRGLDARRNEYELTKSLVENLEGFPDSVKFLKKSAEWIKNAPLLSDVFATEEAFKVAFENLLDPYLNYYVVETREDALQAVKLLSDSSKGRANFFILEELEDYEAEPRRDFAEARPALDLVEYADKYAKLAAFLLDKVYVVDDEHKIPSPIPAGIHFITRSGSIIRRRFVLSGGSVGLFQGKRLGRAKNLEKLSKEIRQFEKELNTLKTNLDREEKRLQELKSHEFGKELDQQNQALARLNRDLDVLEARDKEYREFISQAGERVGAIEEQIEGLEKDIEEISPKIEKLQSEFGEKSAIVEEASRMLEGSQSELSELSQDFNQHNIRHIQLNNQFENLNRDIDQKIARLRQLEENEKKQKAELEDTQKQIHDIVENTLQNDEEIVGLYEEKKRKEERTEKFEQVTVTIRDHIGGVEDKIRVERNKKEEIEERKNEIREKVTDIKIKLNGLKERMEVEFETDISALEEEELFPEGIDKIEPSEIEAKMLKSREKLQRYGEINPMAVEAYTEMKERHDFILEQKQDLEDARQTLLDTIKEIDQTATEKFMEAFNEIRTNFIKVFQSLFSEGDTCNLELANPDDPLESPIKIMAKPKGKRPLTINQLSGGEKTLTAISLLFSIYLLKPAPFCIFDEVDAPLDDANIDKFNNIIKTFSKDSQFIIVTHNKRTMAATNVMYGVTMEKQGVSKVLPVDMVGLNLN